jgi:hypothetical protein
VLARYIEQEERTSPRPAELCRESPDFGPLGLIRVRVGRAAPRRAAPAGRIGGGSDAGRTVRDRVYQRRGMGRSTGHATRASVVK